MLNFDDDEFATVCARRIKTVDDMRRIYLAARGGDAHAALIFLAIAGGSA